MAEKPLFSIQNGFLMIDQIRTSYGALNLSKADSAQPRAKERAQPLADTTPKATQGPGFTSFVTAPYTLLAAQEARDIDELRRDELLREQNKRQRDRTDDAEEDRAAPQTHVQDTDEDTGNVVRFADYVSSSNPAQGVTFEVRPFPAFQSSYGSAQSDTATGVPGPTPRDFAKANSAYRANGAVDGRVFTSQTNEAVYSQILETRFNVVV